MQKRMNKKNGGSRMGAAIFYILLFQAVFASVTNLNIQTAPVSVTLFEIGLGDNVRSPEGAALGSLATQELEKALKQDKRVRVTMFSRTHPAVRRAVSEGSIPNAFLLPPFTGRAGGEYKAVTLGRLVRAEFCIAAVIERFSYNSEQKSSTMEGVVEITNIKTGKLHGSLAMNMSGTGEDIVEGARSAVQNFAQAASSQILAMMFAPEKDDGKKER